MIDWEAQWELHSPGFQDGLLKLDMGLKLKPGPGFGDLSHPTTRMSLQLLKDVAMNKYLIDIGTGSGILALAGALFGAKKVYANDIVPEAVEHAKMNAKLNGLEDRCRFGLAKEKIPTAREEAVITMNMISSEQARVLEDHPELEDLEALWITSGVLIEQEEDYARWCEQRGLKLGKRLEEEGWVAHQWLKFNH